MLTKLDDADWHFDPTPSELDDDDRWAIAAAHLGLFAKWASLKGWLVPLFEDGIVIDAARLAALNVGSISGTQFVLEASDGKLLLEQFSDDAKPFVEAYLGDSGSFLDDVQVLMAKNMYHRREDEYDFEAFSAILEHRLASFSVDPRSVAKSTAKPTVSVSSFAGSLFGHKGR